MAENLKVKASYKTLDNAEFTAGATIDFESILLSTEATRKSEFTFKESKNMDAVPTTDTTKLHTCSTTCECPNDTILKFDVLPSGGSPHTLSSRNLRDAVNGLALPKEGDVANVPIVPTIETEKTKRPGPIDGEA